ncbi:MULTISPECIES: hypothetical protein [Mediterranea]|uniref:hypothetical protein n=1 Tax=Mediterranea TaxID=1926659 RepID=UPI0020112146|nr:MULTISPECIES: hypothetical protein [Mediterranea]MCL1607950.1 hypothetical protein [Mediterranea sp. ET5]MDM8123620.1 hypothetical protein [Mediterranea massiliensis]MDM8199225.1 hypothetical protein [Mediterranea massiliensis]
MKLTRPQIESMQEDMTSDLLTLLMEDRGMTMEAAMNLLYNSDTFERLLDPRSGLYYQSSGYVLDSLDNELTTGKSK